MKLSPHARAIRDVEDEELWSFFYGMSPWQVKLVCLEILNYRHSSVMVKNDLIDFTLQFILMVAASSVGEELFYRAAVQVCLRASVLGFDCLSLEMS